MLSRSRSMFKDRGCASVAVGESPRPTRFQEPPRSSYDGASNLKKPAPSCSRDQAVVADRRKASSAVAPEPFLVKASRDDMPAPLVLVASKERDLPYRSGAITPAGCGNELDSKSNVQEHVDRSPDKFGSEEITGDSDTEPSYVYVKKDSDEQIPRPPPPETPAAAAADDAEEEFRRESSESLYSNVQSSFSPRSESELAASSATTGSSPRPSATAQSPEASVSPRPRKSAEAEEGAEKRVPAPTTTPRSSAQSPMDAVNGLKRLLTFGKRSGNGKASEAAAAGERAPRSVPPAPPARHGDDSDDLDNSYVISPHGNSSTLSGSAW